MDVGLLEPEPVRKMLSLHDMAWRRVRCVSAWLGMVGGKLRLCMAWYKPSQTGSCPKRMACMVGKELAVHVTSSLPELCMSLSPCSVKPCPTVMDP